MVAVPGTAEPARLPTQDNSMRCRRLGNQSASPVRAGFRLRLHRPSTRPAGARSTGSARCRHSCAWWSYRPEEISGTTAPVCLVQRRCRCRTLRTLPAPRVSAHRIQTSPRMPAQQRQHLRGISIAGCNIAGAARAYLKPHRCATRPLKSAHHLQQAIADKVQHI